MQPPLPVYSLSFVDNVQYRNPMTTWITKSTSFHMIQNLNHMKSLFSETSNKAGLYLLG